MMYGRCTQKMCVADYGGVRESCGEDNLNMKLTSTMFVMEVFKRHWFRTSYVRLHAWNNGLRCMS
jgi:hypothetical protein